MRCGPVIAALCPRLDCAFLPRRRTSRMPKSSTTIDDHIGDILQARRATKAARFKPLPDGVEHVDDVMRQALASLHEGLAPLGFKAAPSQLTLSRRLGELTQVIGLRPDSSNLSGASVLASVHVQVKSASHKRWTASEGTRYAREHLWARQLGDLGEPRGFLQWQLVDPATRDAELADMLDRVRALALPALDAWRDKAAIAEALSRDTEQGRADWLVETALWAGHREIAQRLLHAMLSAKTNLRLTYREALPRYLADASIAEPLRRDPATCLAFLAARHGLDAD